jgi:hypothetical protein
MPRQFPSRLHQFFQYVAIVDKYPECLTWIGTTSGTKIRAGVERKYGRFRVVHSRPLAHRWIYDHVVGPIPVGHDVHHTCGNTLCVNTAHLTTLDAHDHRQTWERRS